MREQKQEMYLSEMFLETLDGDFTLKAVLRALEECDEVIVQRQGVCGSVEKFMKPKCGVSKLFLKMPLSIRQEIWDFWDVYGEFDYMLTPGMKRRFSILQMV